MPTSTPTPSPDDILLPDSAIPSARAHHALVAWSASRTGKRPDGTHVSHRLEYIDRDSGSTHRIIVRELVRSEQGCTATLHLVGAMRDHPDDDPSEPAEIRERPLGRDCCDDDVCPERAPSAWMIHLQEAIVTDDLAGLRALIDPKHGVRLVTSCSGDGCIDEDETSKTLTRAAITPEALQDAELSLEADEIECKDAQAEPGVFSCWVIGGGFEASFEWTRSGTQVFVTEIDARGH
jgi:hypothetical protein